MGIVTPEDLEAFVSLFDASDWDQVHVEFGDFVLHLGKSPEDVGHKGLSPAKLPPSIEAPPASAAPPPKEADPKVPSPREEAVPTGWVAVRAPHLGTFYRSPKPGAAPYVEVGQVVTAVTDVCLLEVMKLFTTLRAGASGILRRVCVEDSQMVESGDLLFLLEPNS